MKPGNIRNILSSHTIASGVFSSSVARKNKEERYDNLMRGINIFSYSTFGKEDECSRKFALHKLHLARKHDLQLATVESPFKNVDFAFGKAVETGVQGALLGKSKTEVFFDMFLAWNLPLLMEHPKNYAKTFTDAWIAIEKFFWIKDNIFEGWEIAWFNGKPAIELAFCIDLENGYYYVGHGDIVLYNKDLNRYKVLEIKTTAAANLDEAMYKNSDQAVGYSVIVDEIANDVEASLTFEVFYLVFSTSDNNWHLFEFTKSRSNRAGWINTVLLNVQRIAMYRQVNFFPKKGSACYNWYRRCEYFDICDLDLSHFREGGEFTALTSEDMEKEKFDFRFSLSKIIETQKEHL